MRPLATISVPRLARRYSGWVSRWSPSSATGIAPGTERRTTASMNSRSRTSVATTITARGRT